MLADGLFGHFFGPLVHVVHDVDDHVGLFGKYTSLVDPREQSYAVEKEQVSDALFALFFVDAVLLVAAAHVGDLHVPFIPSKTLFHDVVACLFQIKWKSVVLSVEHFELLHQHLHHFGVRRLERVCTRNLALVVLTDRFDTCRLVLVALSNPLLHYFFASGRNWQTVNSFFGFLQLFIPSDQICPQDHINEQEDETNPIHSSRETSFNFCR